jgi:hypothetical protein
MTRRVAGPGSVRVYRVIARARATDADVALIRPERKLFIGEIRVQIDHPLEPGNKYLNHASVESSEMKTEVSANRFKIELIRPTSRCFWVSGGW